MILRFMRSKANDAVLTHCKMQRLALALRESGAYKRKQALFREILKKPPCGLPNAFMM